MGLYDRAHLLSSHIERLTAFLEHADADQEAMILGALESLLDGIDTEIDTVDSLLDGWDQ